MKFNSTIILTAAAAMAATNVVAAPTFGYLSGKAEAVKGDVLSGIPGLASKYVSKVANSASAGHTGSGECYGSNCGAPKPPAEQPCMGPYCPGSPPPPPPPPPPAQCYGPKCPPDSPPPAAAPPKECMGAECGGGEHEVAPEYGPPPPNNEYAPPPPAAKYPPPPPPPKYNGAGGHENLGSKIWGVAGGLIDGAVGVATNVVGKAKDIVGAKVDIATNVVGTAKDIVGSKLDKVGGKLGY